MPRSQQAFFSEMPVRPIPPPSRPLQVFPVDALSPRGQLQNALAAEKAKLESLRLLEIDDRAKLVDQYELLSYEARQAQFRTQHRQWNGSDNIEDRWTMAAAAHTQLLARLEEILHAEVAIEGMRIDLDDVQLWEGGAR